MEKWYPRSFGDGDTHRCEQANADATVTARCGVTFAPQHRLFGEGPMVVRPPVEPVLACPECVAAETKAVDPDGAAVRGLIETLSSPRSLRKRFRLWTKKDGVGNV